MSPTPKPAAPEMPSAALPVEMESRGIHLYADGVQVAVFSNGYIAAEERAALASELVRRYNAYTEAPKSEQVAAMHGDLIETRAKLADLERKHAELLHVVEEALPSLRRALGAGK